MGKVDLIPSNYLVVQDSNNHLFGIARKDKTGKTVPIIPCMNRAAAVARSYNRIYMMYLPMMSENGAMVVRNYSGEVQSDDSIANIKFGKECIYAKMIEPRTGKMVWALLDKNLQPIKYLKDFEFTCLRNEYDFYLPSGRERLEVKGIDGQIYHLTAKTGELEEYHKYEKKLKSEIVNIPAEKYNIVVDSYKNSIKAIQFPGNIEVGINTIADVKLYVDAFSKLLGTQYITKKENIQVGRHEEENSYYLYKDIEAPKAELFFKIIRCFRSYDSLTNLIMLARYLQLSGVDNANLMQATYEELKNPKYCIYLGEDEYKIKIYSIGNDIFGFLTKPESRFTTFQYTLVPGGHIKDEGIISLTTAYSTNKAKIAEIKVTDCRVMPKQSRVYEKFSKSSGYLPYNVLKNPSLKGRIDNYSYMSEYIADLSVVPIVNDVEGEAFDMRVIIGDGLKYTPKHRANDKNIVYSGKTNDIFIYLA